MKNYKIIILVVALLSSFPVGAMEQSSYLNDSMLANPARKTALVNSQLTSKQQKELRQAIMNTRPILEKKYSYQELSSAEKGLLTNAEPVIGKYVLYDLDDSFVADKVNNHMKFLKKVKNVGKLQQQAMQSECCICFDEKSREIPCENEHKVERICQGCLDDLIAQSKPCPICRGKLIKEEKGESNEKL